MPDNYIIKPFTAIDIEKYHQGQLTPREMHDLEKAALDDPFLADALEGYAAPGVRTAADLAELKKRLGDRTGTKKVIPLFSRSTSSFPWMRAAVLVVLIGGGALLTYQFFFKNKQENIAYTDEQVINKKSKAGTDSATTSLSNGANGNNKEPETSTLATAPLPNKADLMTDSVTVSSGYLNMSTSPVQEKRADPKDITSTWGRQASADSMKNVTASLGENRKKEAAEYKNQDDKEMAAKMRNAPATRSEDKYYDNNGMVAQQKPPYRANVFRGRVTDANNNALPFANVTNTADNIGTYSDARGNFTLTSPDSILNVQVRSLGFENNSIQLQNTVTDNQVVMQEDRSLSEVIVSKTKSLNSSHPRNSTMVLEEPEPIDGWVNYDSYLANNLNVPETFKNKQSNGEVTLSFEVNKKGEPVNITVEKSLCESCDKEAIRLVKQGPKWKQKAKKGRTSVTISF